MKGQRQRLLNYARKHKQDYNFVLRQYVLQRLMYRLGSSEYASDFLLKGGLLFWVWQKCFHRPTQDMDLLGFGSDDIFVLKSQFLSITQVTGEQDPVVNIIDFDHWQNNRFVAINQFRIDTPGGVAPFIIP